MRWQLKKKCCQTLCTYLAVFCVVISLVELTIKNQQSWIYKSFVSLKFIGEGDIIAQTNYNGHEEMFTKRDSLQSISDNVNRVQEENSHQIPVNSVVSFENSTSSELEDVFISVKTTLRYHKDRVKLQIDTWWPMVKKQVYFFTDGNDPELNEQTGGRVINTNCTSSHKRNALCCKMAAEFDHFILSNKRWWCHVDDDTYLHVPAMAALLHVHNASRDWYLGRPSLSHALQIRDFRNPHAQEKLSFWFATGGAGFCISRVLALRMMPLAGGGRLKTQCANIRLPDDCAIGYIVKYGGQSALTVIPDFHSHLENLAKIKAKDVHKIISMSYNYNTQRQAMNAPRIDGFSQEQDPTRIRTLHCLLFPHLPQCPPELFSQD